MVNTHIVNTEKQDKEETEQNQISCGFKIYFRF